MLPKLGINIDHIATLRQLRGTPYPDVVAAAHMAEDAGADQITAHLREDRRHIQDADIKRLRAELRVPLNMEMGATDEMTRIALRIRPDWVCLVPEKRQEVTTEGGLDLIRNKKRLALIIRKLKKAGILVSTFIEPTTQAVEISAELGVDAVELHTGRYCLCTQQSKIHAKKVESELQRIKKAAIRARKLGIRPHAGHGFDYENVRAVAALEVPEVEGSRASKALIEEYNIGHAVICRASLVGITQAVREMVSAIRAP